MGGFFARPDDTVRIQFSDGPLAGEWIQIRRRLSAVEEQRLTAKMAKGRYDEEQRKIIVDIDLAEATGEKLLAWLTGWSLKDSTEYPAPCNRYAIESLLPEYAAAIVSAIDAHDAAQKATEGPLVVDPLPAPGDGSTAASPTNGVPSLSTSSTVYDASRATA